MASLCDNLAKIGSSDGGFCNLLVSQKELFHGQIDELQKIVLTQCRLTGVNPLSQEMAAGALCIKIGKRPRDLLTPKAVKYMQAIFSIKDDVSKKESRELSTLFGITFTQVRDFFAGQRSRVRKLVRLSKDKAARIGASAEHQANVSSISDHLMPGDAIPLRSVNGDEMPLNFSEPPNPILLSPENPIPLNIVAPLPLPLNSASQTVEGPAMADSDALLGMDAQDKHFVENIFLLLHNEATFSGQEKLMEWIIKIQSPSVLNWFIDKGGLLILTTWLSEAAVEEQTSVIIIIFKVLIHLPLHKAVPDHVSAILHNVNRLRFYKVSVISKRATILLSRWSKTFAESQNKKKSNGFIFSTNVQDKILNRSIPDVFRHCNDTSSEDALTCDSLNNVKKIVSSQALKLLPATLDDPSRKIILGSPSSYARDRRKVQLVEQPDQRVAGRNPQALKSLPASQGRPMSADDIQKAKMRALWMQRKHGEVPSSSGGSQEMKAISADKSTSSNGNPPLKGPKGCFWSKAEEYSGSSTPPATCYNKPDNPPDVTPKVELQEAIVELNIPARIPWLTPPEMELDSRWRIGAGENSKEAGVEKNRNCREIEAMYETQGEIPANPKEPWDVEMDYDDTLTPRVPTDQPPDAEGEETCDSCQDDGDTSKVAPPSALTSQFARTTEPDFELLAVLLRNPELVFALTSGQAASLPSEEMVRLLDLIKMSGSSLASPSPSNVMRSGRQEVVEKTQFSRQIPKFSSILGAGHCQKLAASGAAPYQEDGSSSQLQSRATEMAAFPMTAPAPAPSPAMRFSSANGPSSSIQYQLRPASAPAGYVMGTVPNYGLLQGGPVRALGSYLEPRINAAAWGLLQANNNPRQWSTSPQDQDDKGGARYRR